MLKVDLGKFRQTSTLTWNEEHLEKGTRCLECLKSTPFATEYKECVHPLESKTHIIHAPSTSTCTYIIFQWGEILYPLFLEDNSVVHFTHFSKGPQCKNAPVVRSCNELKNNL